MSIKICTQIWGLDLEPIDKLLLLALADYANDDGGEIYPGYDTLAQKTGVTKRTLITKIQQYENCKILNRKTTISGRGNRQEFALSLELIGEAGSPIKELLKGESERRKRVNLTAQKGESDDIKGESDDIKGESDCIPPIPPYKENRHEFTDEPSMNRPVNPTPVASLRSQPPASKRVDPEYEKFAAIHLELKHVPYVNKTADFVQLANLRKKLLAQDWELTAQRWETAVRNYFASEIGNHTLADLSARFATFAVTSLDRFGKPTVTAAAQANPQLATLSPQSQANYAAGQRWLARSKQND